MMIDRRMIRLTAGVRGRIAVKVGLGLGLLTAGVASGIASAEVLARILAGEELDAVLPLLALVGALIGVQAAGRWFQELLAIWIATGVKLRLRLRLYQRLLDLGPGYLARTQTGKVLASVVDGVEHLEGYLGLYIPQAFIAFVGPLAIVIYLMTIDPYVGLIVLISVLVSLFGAQFFERALGEYGQEHWNAYRDLNAEFMDTMQGLPTLKAYNAGKRHGLRLHERAQALYRATIKQMSISLLGTGVTQFATGAGTALATGVAAIQFTRGELTATELFIVLFLSAQCFLPLFEFNQYWHQGFLGLSALAGISELLETKPEVRDQPLRGPTQPQPEGPPAIELEQVTFSYRDGSRPALRDVSLRVEPGRKTAIVGRSGSGKTTVVALLARFFDPQAGAIQIDGRNLREIPLEQLREMIAVVAQDTYLFYGTLADNLRMARPQATLAELEAAAWLANAHAFIMATPDGYETLIGERGLTLSGGQRQRIAIARAILKDAPILLLDEATASVDAANEKLIQDALDGLARDRTTLIVAHRLSTIANADQIIVLDEGALVESGRHAELLRRQGAYSRLIAAQRGKGR